MDNNNIPEWQEESLEEFISKLSTTEDENSETRIAIFGAQYLSPEMKKMLGIK